MSPLKISELIAALQEVQATYGDCEVRIADPHSGEDPNQDSLPTAVETVRALNETTYVSISTIPVAWRR